MDTKDSQGRTSLHRAALFGDAKILKLLLENGADVNIKDNEGKTPLHLVDDEEPDCVKLLITHGANIEAQDNDGRVPLQLAAQSGRINLVQILLDQGQDIDTPLAKDPTPPLHLALDSQQASCAKYLLDRGASLAPPKARHASRYVYDVKCIKLLLDKGVDVNFHSGDGETMLHNVIHRSIGLRLKGSLSRPTFEETLASCQYLLEKGANPNIADWQSLPPLFWAISKAKNDQGLLDLRLVELLLDYGADVNAKDAKGRTLLCIFRKSIHKHLYWLLESRGAVDEWGWFRHLLWDQFHI